MKYTVITRTGEKHYKLKRTRTLWGARREAKRMEATNPLYTKISRVE